MVGRCPVGRGGCGREGSAARHASGGVRPARPAARERSPTATRPSPTPPATPPSPTPPGEAARSPAERLRVPYDRRPAAAPQPLRKPRMRRHHRRIPPGEVLAVPGRTRAYPLGGRRVASPCPRARIPRTPDEQGGPGGRCEQAPSARPQRQARRWGRRHGRRPRQGSYGSDGKGDKAAKRQSGDQTRSSTTRHDGGNPSPRPPVITVPVPRPGTTQRRHRTRITPPDQDRPGPGPHDPIGPPGPGGRQHPLRPDTL
ncbi:hypothetical protein STENM223S_11051 [Streptomyces tendae]